MLSSSLCTLNLLISFTPRKETTLQNMFIGLETSISFSVLCTENGSYILTKKPENDKIFSVATCSAGVAELADAHDSKSCG